MQQHQGGVLLPVALAGGRWEEQQQRCRRCLRQWLPQWLQGQQQQQRRQPQQQWQPLEGKQGLRDQQYRVR